MPWYRAGTATVTSGSANVIGSTTGWVAGGVALGDVFTADNVTLYEIIGLADDTHLTLDRPYAGSSGTGSYAIIRNLSPPGAAMMTSVVALTGAVESLVASSAPNLGLAAAFAVTPQAVPGLGVQVASGILQVAGAPTVIAAQSLAVASAPVAHPRLDLVTLDIFTGLPAILTGAEAAVPALPILPAGKIPLASLALSVGQTAIAAAQITDLRPLFEDGLTSGRINARSFGAIGDAISNATAILIVPAGLTAGATVTIGGTTITAVSGAPSGAQWQVTGSISGTLVAGASNDVTRIRNAINANITTVTASLGAGPGQILISYKDATTAGNAVTISGSAGFTVTDLNGATQVGLTGGTAMSQTPNAAALQAAINAAVLAAAGYPYEVFIPDGTYLCEASLSIPSNIRLRGVGAGIYGAKGTRLIRAGNFPLVVCTGISSTIQSSPFGLVSAVAMEDICLDGGDSFGAGSQATGTIAFSSAVAVGNSVTHRGINFTAVAAGTALTATTFTGGVSRDADLASLLAQLQASPSANVQESTYRISAPGTITITAIAHGTAGNGYSLAKSGSAITVSGSTLSGGGARWTADLVQLTACYEFKFSRVWFTSCAGRALKTQEFWDSRFTDCRITFCGSQDGTLPAFSFLSATYSPNYETTNNIYLAGCRFESNPGVCLETTGNNGIDIWFSQTKFECTGKQLDYLVRVSQATAIHFDPCWMYVAPSYWATKSWSDTTTTLAPVVGTINLTVATGDPDIYAASSTNMAAQPVGMSVLVYATGARQNWMTGRVTAYNSSTGAVQIVTDQAAGSSQTGWTMVPCHPGLLYAHGSQHLAGTIIGGAVSNIPGVLTTYLKCFLHLDACLSSDLEFRAVQGTGTLIAAALLGYHDTTTTGSVQSTALGGQSNFTIETGQSINPDDWLYISGNTTAYASDWMTGRVVSYNAGTGALTVNVDQYGWGGVSGDVISSWLLIPSPAKAALITNPVAGNPKLNITGSASPYGNQVSTNFSPTPVTVEGLNIAKFGGPGFKFQNLAFQDQLILDHRKDFQPVSGTEAMTGAYQLYVYDFARGAPYNVLMVDGNRNLALQAPVLMRNLLRWYDTSQGGTYSTTTQLWSNGTYNQTQIRGSVFGAAYLPVDGSGNLSGVTGDVFLNTALASGSTRNGAPLVERFVCVAPLYSASGTTYPAIWMHPAPLQLSGPRAAITAGAIAYGYAQGTYYEFTDPIAGDYEGLKVVASGADLVWKPVRPIAA